MTVTDTMISPTGFSYIGRIDPYAHLMCTKDGRRAPEALVEAFSRLGLSVSDDIANVHSIDLDTLDGALAREKARIAALEAAHTAKITEYVNESQARVDECNAKRADYETRIIPLKRAAAESMIAAIVNDGDEVPEHLTHLAEVVRDTAEATLEESAYEYQCRQHLDGAHLYARSARFEPYPSEHTDRAGSMIPNALTLIGHVVKARKVKRAAEAEKLRAQLRHLGVEV